MLEDLNSVLNNGDVPNIYHVDEMEKIFHSMRGQVQEAGLQINRSNLFSAYVKTVRNKLHVVITMRYFRIRLAILIYSHLMKALRITITANDDTNICICTVVASA